VARVERIEPDPERPGHHFAYVRDYLPFDAPVALRGPFGYREARLRRVADPRDVGRALQGWSVRELLDGDFREIVGAGFMETLAPNNAIRLDLARPDLDREAAAILSTPPADRVVERMLVNRTIRDAAFRRAVLDAYHDTCAVTELRIVNGGGRAEAQAAHIVPVAEGGPDVVQNGIALSATAHWLFDRHLISVDENWRMLVSHNKVPSSLRSIFMPDNAPIRLPADRALWPHPAFMARHRERFAFG
jgi:putative restriction endonuclease